MPIAEYIPAYSRVTALQNIKATTKTDWEEWGKLADIRVESDTRPGWKKLLPLDGSSFLNPSVPPDAWVILRASGGLAILPNEEFRRKYEQLGS